MGAESRQAGSGGSGQTGRCMPHPEGAATAQCQLSETREKGEPSVVTLCYTLFTSVTL